MAPTARKRPFFAPSASASPLLNGRVDKAASVGIGFVAKISRSIWRLRRLILLLVTILGFLRVLAPRDSLSASSQTMATDEAEAYWAWSRLDPSDRYADRFKKGRVDGRVLLREGEPHPIPALIAAAKKNWMRLNDRQSRTFAQACREYARRYGRPPPRGFDQWYAFARLHNVRMIDEYDLIERDLRPFRAFRPANFRERTFASMQRFESHGWGLSVFEGTLFRNGSGAYHSRARAVVEMVDDFAHHLPDMFTWHNHHDNGFLMTPWEERVRLNELVEAKKYDTQDGPPYMPIARAPDPQWQGWQMCTPDSPMRQPNFTYGTAQRGLTGLEMQDPPDGADGAVVGSWKLTMDPCYNDQIRFTHAATAWIYPHDPQPLLPFFVPGVHWHLPDIRTIVPEQFEFKPFYDPPWELRPFTRLVWRGQTSGCFWDQHTAWNATHRARLHHLTHNMRGSQRVVGSDDQGNVKVVNEASVVVNSIFFDAGMNEPPVQCAEADGTCDLLYHVFDGFDKRMPVDVANLYKYALDIDGNSWSGRFRRLMSSNAAVIKATLYPEFFTDHLMPWVHFIPIQVDYSDLHSVMAFFRGGLPGLKSHDHLAKEIALAGKEWAKKHLRMVDAQAYMFRL